MAQSSPGGYRQMIGHVDRVSKLQAEQKRDRAADVEHNRQAAAAHRAYNKSWEWGVDLEGKSRDVALKLDAMVRGQNYDMEMKSIQKAHDSAVNNAYAKSDAKKVEMDQLAGLVKQVTGVATQYIENTNKARDNQNKADAQMYDSKYKLSLETQGKIKSINWGMLDQEAKQSAFAELARESGQPVSSIEGYASLSDGARVILAHNTANKKFENLSADLALDPDTKIDGLTYVETVHSKDLNIIPNIDRFFRQKEQIIFRRLEEMGMNVNPQLMQTFSGHVDKQSAAATSRAIQLAEKTIIADKEDRDDNLLLQQMGTIGMPGIVKSWEQTPATGPNGEPGFRKKVIQNTLDSAKRLAKDGIFTDDDLGELGAQLVQGIPLRQHKSFIRGNLNEIQKEINSARGVVQQDRILDQKEAAFQDEQTVRGVIKKTPPGDISLEQVNAMRTELLKRGNLSESKINSLMNVLISRMPQSQIEQKLSNVLGSTGYSGFTPDATIEQIGQGDHEAIKKTKNQNLANRNQNQTWKAIQGMIKSSAAKALGISKETRIGESHYHLKVLELERVAIGLMEQYTAEGKGNEWAGSQVLAIVQGWADKITEDPFGNHHFGVPDKSKPGNAHKSGFNSVEAPAEEVVPISKIKTEDLTREFKSVNIEPTKRSGIKARIEYIKTNPAAMRGLLDTNAAIDMLNDMNSGNIVNQRTVDTFTKLGAYLGGMSPSSTAKLWLTGQGKPWIPPKDENQKWAEKLFNNTPIQRVNQLYGRPNVENNLLQGQSVTIPDGYTFEGYGPSLPYTGDLDGWPAGTDIRFRGGQGAPIYSGTQIRIISRSKVDGHAAYYEQGTLGRDGASGSGFGRSIAFEAFDDQSGTWHEVMLGHLDSKSPLAGMAPGTILPVGTLIGNQGASGRSLTHGGGPYDHITSHSTMPKLLMRFMEKTWFVSHGGTQQQPQQRPITPQQVIPMPSGIGQTPWTPKGNIPALSKEPLSKEPLSKKPLSKKQQQAFMRTFMNVPREDEEVIRAGGKTYYLQPNGNWLTAEDLANQRGTQ